ncbi:MAG: hypothetical protein M1816_007937 [Peltula sp. TS41687]|nr:MAG: hypothetical protein M1816_007937 [Peltula sp. TS41687]
MQKVLQRTARAKTQAARRAAIRWEKERSTRRTLQRSEHDELWKMASRDIKNARIARREDRELGPLAPKRDVGDSKETYGVLDSRRTRGPIKREEDKKDAQLIVAGDRVVIIEGRDKGRIGPVVRVDRKRHEAVVKGLNLVDIAVPEWMQQGEQKQPPVTSMEAAIPLPSLRLVHALTDPDTGKTRDVIVKKIEVRDAWFDRHLGIHRSFRVIPGLEVVVPWPKRERKEPVENDCDTLRMEVESKTWVPTLLRRPMPSSVIDELRNKYSKFRSRHDEWFIAKKTAEDEQAKREKLRLNEAGMTPVQQLRELRRRERKAAGELQERPKLSEDMLIRIGEIMAKNKGLMGSKPKEEAVSA